MTTKADAIDEAAVAVPGADQDDSDNAEFSAAFDEEAGEKTAKPKFQPDGALPFDEASDKAKPKPETDKGKADDKPRGADGKFLPDADKDALKGKPDAAATKTAAEKVEAAAAALDAKPAVKATPDKPEDSSGDVIDILPPEYTWARQVRESGKLAEFLATQPKAVRKAATSGDPDDAVYVLDLYRKAQEPAPATTKADKKALLDEFGAVTFTAPDGSERTLKDLAEEYQNHELLEAIFAGVKNMMSKDGPRAKDDKAGGVDALQQRLNVMKADQEYWDVVVDAHSDAKRLVRTPAFHDWVEKNGSEGLKRLYRSPIPEHAILVLDAYKEVIAKGAASGAVTDAAKRKEELDGLHSESVRPRRAAAKPSEDEDDFDKGFEEGLK